MQVNITMGNVKDLQNREIAELKRDIASYVQHNTDLLNDNELLRLELNECRAQTAAHAVDAASIASKYTDRSNLRLLCGELSPQEMRTAIAVANAIAREIEGLEKV